MDFDSVPAFNRFEEFIKIRVRQRDAMVAIIRSQWPDLLREYVRIGRLEVLQLGKVIAPMAIQGATLPRTPYDPAHPASVRADPRIRLVRAPPRHLRRDDMARLNRAAR